MGKEVAARANQRGLDGYSSGFGLVSMLLVSYLYLRYIHRSAL